MRVHAIGNHHTSVRRQIWPDNRCIGRAVTGNANEWFYDRTGLNLMIVLPDDPLFAANVQRTENLLERRI